jgi:Trk-type K+ transport system membrane component
MQLGGLNILTFAMFFAFLYTRSVGIGFNTILKDIFSLKQYSDIKRIIKKIIIISFSIELVGIFFLYFSWDNDLPFNSGGEKLFYSVFHAVSAFNNAGFSLFKNGLFENIVLKNYAVHYIIAILIILGGLGFTVLSEIFSATNIKNHLHTKTSFFSVNSKIVIYTTLALLVMGTGLFFILEYNNSLVRMSFAEKISIAFFQSVTTRTAGFNTVDFGHLLMPTYWLMILFMFIGASPGSTGGGIKTTTFMLLFKSGIANLRQQKNVNFFKKSIPYSHVDYAYALALLAAVFIFTATFLLSITETGKTFAALLFESVSAFATVGLSTGITASLSLAGKWIIITSMFIGRIGPLTLTLSFMSNPHKEKVYFAKSDILVG